MTAREFQTVKDSAGLLASWADVLPQPVNEAVRAPELRRRFGERHGSWFLTVEWTQAGLLRSASLAITNADVTQDDVAAKVVVSVQAAASSSNRFVAEILYQSGRRTVKRLTTSDFMDWLRAAIERAQGYSEASLVQAYNTEALR